jgi:fatty-acyl-CoA synthase
MTTFAELLRERATDPSTGLLFEDEVHTWSAVVQAASARAGLLSELLADRDVRHVGVLLENVPEYLYWIFGATLAGGAVVGINATQRGENLARDIRHADCAVIITDRAQRHLLDMLDAESGGPTILCVDDEDYAVLLGAHRDAPLPATLPSPDARLLILATSGTTSAPKLVSYSQARLASVAAYCVELCELDDTSVAYLAMPLFHGAACTASMATMVATGGTIAMRRRFSASGFLPDVRCYGATFFNYVGRVMAYILATPEQPGDADNTLRLAFGAEASHPDRERFAARFGCPSMESYGSSEGPITIRIVPGTPAGALGLPSEGQDVAIVDPATGARRVPARFDADGRLVNGEDAVGEIVGLGMGHLFEGYYNNPEATALRVRDGHAWSGDLGYRDADGWFWYAGRTGDWLRVDGENFAIAPVERLLLRHDDVVMCAAYAVPDPQTGDQLMAALQLAEGATFDPPGFRAFLEAQPDLGSKWVPRFVRIVAAIPTTQTHKVVKAGLRAEAWHAAEPIWWRPWREQEYRLLTDDDRAELDEVVRRHGRVNTRVA